MALLRRRSTLLRCLVRTRRYCLNGEGKEINIKKESEGNMVSVSEQVSLGHPDKTADAITSAVLDAYLEKDPGTRYAVECQVKDQNVVLAGEVTSRASLSTADVFKTVVEAIDRIGYSREYASRWPEGVTLDSSRVQVMQFISRQSPDIARGVDADGWGDQGVFAGMATNDPLHDYMPLDHWYAKEICRRLYNEALVGKIPVGLDIKTQVSMDGKFVTEVIVAAPMMPCDKTLAESCIRAVVRDVIHSGCGPDSVIINGTGSYVVHSSVGDCGTTGRKLAVDFYGLNCPIGGGAPWSKDGTKADVALNLAARCMAVEAVKENPWLVKAFVKCSCCIGRPEVRIALFDENNRQIDERCEKMTPASVIERFGLRKPIFFDLCRDGLFSKVDSVAAKI